MLIVDLLPGKAAVDRKERASSAYDISSDAAESLLQLNALYRTLQKVGQARVVPVVPAKKVLSRDRNLVSCRSGDTSTGGKYGIVGGSRGPPFGAVFKLGIEIILRRFVAFCVSETGSEELSRVTVAHFRASSTIRRLATASREGCGGSCPIQLCTGLIFEKLGS